MQGVYALHTVVKDVRGERSIIMSAVALLSTLFSIILSTPVDYRYNVVAFKKSRSFFSIIRNKL